MSVQNTVKAQRMLRCNFGKPMFGLRVNARALGSAADAWRPHNTAAAMRLAGAVADKFEKQGLAPSISLAGGRFTLSDATALQVLRFAARGNPAEGTTYVFPQKGMPEIHLTRQEGQLALSCPDAADKDEQSPPNAKESIPVTAVKPLSWEEENFPHMREKAVAFEQADIYDKLLTLVYCDDIERMVGHLSKEFYDEARKNSGLIRDLYRCCAVFNREDPLKGLRDDSDSYTLAAGKVLAFYCEIDPDQARQEIGAYMRMDRHKVVAAALDSLSAQKALDIVRSLTERELLVLCRVIPDNNTKFWGSLSHLFSPAVYYFLCAHEEEKQVLLFALTADELVELFSLISSDETLPKEVSAVEKIVIEGLGWDMRSFLLLYRQLAAIGRRDLQLVLFKKLRHERQLASWLGLTQSERLDFSDAFPENILCSFISSAAENPMDAKPWLSAFRSIDSPAWRRRCYSMLSAEQRKEFVPRFSASECLELFRIFKTDLLSYTALKQAAELACSLDKEERDALFLNLRSNGIANLYYELSEKGKEALMLEVLPPASLKKLYSRVSLLEQLRISYFFGCRALGLRIKLWLAIVLGE